MTIGYYLIFPVVKSLWMTDNIYLATRKKNGLIFKKCPVQTLLISLSLCNDSISKYRIVFQWPRHRNDEFLI